MISEVKCASMVKIMQKHKAVRFMRKVAVAGTTEQSIIFHLKHLALSRAVGMVGII
jgi:hypothetical protein